MERVKRLELSTFAMATRRSSQLSYTRGRFPIWETWFVGELLKCVKQIQGIAINLPKLVQMANFIGLK